MRVLLLLLFSSGTLCGRQLGTVSSHIATFSSETIHRGCYVEGWTGTCFLQFFGQALLIFNVVRVVPVSVCYAMHRGIHGAPMGYLCLNVLRPFLTIQNFKYSRLFQLKHRSRCALPVLKFTRRSIELRDASDEGHDAGGLHISPSHARGSCRPVSRSS